VAKFRRRGCFATFPSRAAWHSLNSLIGFQKYCQTKSGQSMISREQSNVVPRTGGLSTPAYFPINRGEQVIRCLCPAPPTPLSPRTAIESSPGIFRFRQHLLVGPVVDPRNFAIFSRGTSLCMRAARAPRPPVHGCVVDDAIGNHSELLWQKGIVRNASRKASPVLPVFQAIELY
jgi:hypothetical protein